VSHRGVGVKGNEKKMSSYRKEDDVFHFVVLKGDKSKTEVIYLCGIYHTVVTNRGRQAVSTNFFFYFNGVRGNSLTTLYIIFL